MWNRNIRFWCFEIIFFVVLEQISLIQAQTDGLLLSCYTCDGANCNVSNVATLSQSNCIDEQAECTTVFNASGSVIARGCSNLLSTTANATCIASGDQFCFTCSSNECNIAIALDQYIDCFLCGSNEDNNCVWNPTNSSSVTTVKCFEECLVALAPLTVGDSAAALGTYRGCANNATLSSLGFTDCNNSLAGECWTCNQSNCNSFNEPPNRLTCNFCTDDTCTQTVSRICVNYEVDDKCVYVLNNNASIAQLQCASDLSDNTMAYLQAMHTIVECNGINCNTLTNAPNPTITQLSCFSCNSMHNEMCAINPSQLNSTVQCDGLSNMCSTKVTVAGYTVRDCFASESASDFSKCNSGLYSCLTCNGTNCNNQIYPTSRLSCYRCNSTSNPDCGSNSTDISICPVYSQTEFCLAYFSNNVTYRGCWSDFSGCPTTCSTCSTYGCNNNTMNGGGSGDIRATKALMVMALLALAGKAIGL